MGVEEELERRQMRELQAAAEKLVNDPAPTRAKLDALFRRLPRCTGTDPVDAHKLGDDHVDVCFALGRAHATWKSENGAYCDGHHERGLGDEELPYARALRELLSRLRA